MTSPQVSLEQYINDSKVQIKTTTNQGRSLVAKRDISAKENVLFILRPSMIALEIPKLQTTCYYCYKIDGEQQSFDNENENLDDQLKTCRGCGVVKFCNKDCQLAAWSRYHRWECKMYSRLMPRILPSNIRAVIRLLKQRKANLIDDTEWKEILQLQSHQEELVAVGGSTWENLQISVEAVKKYANSEESREIILHLLCVQVINSMTLTTYSFDPLGCVLHPLASMVNHSCEPNAMVRYDLVPSTLPESNGIRPQLGSISIQALRHISKDEQITISYVDPTFPYAMRQKELRNKYFFDCKCVVCQQKENGVPDSFNVKSTTLDLSTLEELFETTSVDEIQSKANLMIDKLMYRKLPDRPGEDAMIRLYLCGFARCHTWPVHRFPYAQIREQLIQTLLRQQDFEGALIHAAIQVRLIDSKLFANPHIPFHPTAAVHKLVLFKLIRWVAAEESKILSMNDRAMISILACALIDELCQSLKRSDYDQGLMEKIVKRQFEDVLEEAYFWNLYREKPALSRENGWRAMDRLIENALKKERQDTIEG